MGDYADLQIISSPTELEQQIKTFRERKIYKKTFFLTASCMKSINYTLVSGLQEVEPGDHSDFHKQALTASGRRFATKTMLQTCHPICILNRTPDALEIPPSRGYAALKTSSLGDLGGSYYPAGLLQFLGTQKNTETWGSCILILRPENSGKRENCGL